MKRKKKRNTEKYKVRDEGRFPPEFRCLHSVKRSAPVMLIKFP